MQQGGPSFTVARLQERFSLRLGRSRLGNQCFTQRVMAANQKLVAPKKACQQGNRGYGRKFASFPPTAVAASQHEVPDPIHHERRKSACRSERYEVVDIGQRFIT